MKAGYRTVFEVIHEARLEQPLTDHLVTDQQMAKWLSECENDIQINVLLMVHEDFWPIRYQEKWLYTAGEDGLDAGKHWFGKPGIDPDTGEEVAEIRVFTNAALSEGDTLVWDGEKLIQTVGGTETELTVLDEDGGEELKFWDESRVLLVPAGWAGLYVDYLLYQMYKDAREYRDARNYHNEYMGKRNDFCGYVGDRWAPARFRG